MEERGRIFDDMAPLATRAMGVARNIGGEMEAFVNARVERFLAKRDWVTREEFDAMRAMFSGDGFRLPSDAWSSPGSVHDR